MTNTLLSIAESWGKTEGLHKLDELLAWVRQRNKDIKVDIRKIPLEESGFWFYDREEGCIRNQNRSFFQITGFENRTVDGVIQTQPIILQPEIGYLGILCKVFNGVMHFLMQAKIEPGNVNKIQLSPTIQATKSNFTQKHGGAKPAYLDYFVNAVQHEIVVDQIQSEQSSRFYKKRNRNIIVRVDEEIPVLPSHRWMTLGQIKRLMREDNLVNMDTRTVLSCIPFSKLQLPALELLELSDCFADKQLYRSVFVEPQKNELPQLYQYINNYKMFSDDCSRLVPLHEMADWAMQDGELICRYPYPFKVVFCDIAIEGREVKQWTQPLFEAVGIATFGLICCNVDGVLKFVVKVKPEVGCFDCVELGPTIQQEAGEHDSAQDVISQLFWDKVEHDQGVMFDHLLSEEGGRFYHEQNRNILLRIDVDDLPELPDSYFLLDYRTLNRLVQINNVLNIQLRNLLSLLEA